MAIDETKGKETIFTKLLKDLLRRRRALKKAGGGDTNKGGPRATTNITNSPSS